MATKTANETSHAMTAQERVHNTLSSHEILVEIDITKDIPSAKKIAAYATEQANNNSSFADMLEIAQSRTIETPDGSTGKLPKDVAVRDQLELLFYLTHVMKPILTVETGFAYGLTASAFLSAHALNNANGGHVPIQNHAMEVNQGIGVHTLKKLRMENYQIMEHEGCVVLPEMMLQKLAPDLRLAYINGEDAYDEAMLEFYYLDRQTLPSGVIAINTKKSKARQELVKFIKKHRPSYKTVETDCGITLVQRDKTPLDLSPKQTKDDE